MHNLKIFYLRACFLLFVKAQLSNAGRIMIDHADSTFACTALIDTMLVRGPHQSEFTRHTSSKPMLLGLHNDWFTLSLYETDAPYTFLTFKQRHVDFELFYSQTMTFRVKVRNDIWHFRCVFSADREILDVMYSYLSLCTAQGFMTHRMDIEKVVSYVRTDKIRDPIVRTVDDLEPASLYEQSISWDNPDTKIFSISAAASEESEHVLSRLVFRSGTFRVAKMDNVVVLSLIGLENWFYILYFQDGKKATDFMNCTTVTEKRDNVVLGIPVDVLSYVQANRGLPPIPYSRNLSKP